MRAILREGRALCRLLDVPPPCAVNELRASLEPHLPIHLSKTLSGTPLENVGVLLIPSLLAVAGFLTPPAHRSCSQRGASSRFRSPTGRNGSSCQRRGYG